MHATSHLHRLLAALLATVLVGGTLLLGSTASAATRSKQDKVGETSGVDLTRLRVTNGDQRLRMRASAVRLPRSGTVHFEFRDDDLDGGAVVVSRRHGEVSAYVVWLTENQAAVTSCHSLHVTWSRRHDRVRAWLKRSCVRFADAPSFRFEAQFGDGDRVRNLRVRKG